MVTMRGASGGGGGTNQEPQAPAGQGGAPGSFHGMIQLTRSKKDIYIVVGAGGAAGFGFIGISILIAAGVSLETMKQVDSQLTMRNYEGFLK